MIRTISFVTFFLLACVCAAATSHADTFEVSEDGEQINIRTPRIEAGIRKKGYVSGVAGGSLLDKKTGFRDPGFGLDIVDWILEPGSDKPYREKLDPELVYRVNTPYHGKTAKRCIEGPQICTQARQVSPVVVRGKDFVGVRNSFTYRTAAPGKKTGSKWSQTVVFPKDTRYFISSDRIDAVNNSEAMFLRIDMPGHLKHTEGDTFTEIYLSYLPLVHPESDYKQTIPASAFFQDFAPDERFNYRRDRQDRPPTRFIRAYRLRDPKTGKPGPWLAGMTLDPSVVYEAWCHQTNYVCMIQEFGGHPVKAGESFGAAFIVGYFDSIAEMHAVYDKYRGFTGLEVSEAGWKLTR